MKKFLLKRILPMLTIMAAVLGVGVASAQQTDVTVGNWSGTTSSAYGGFHNTNRYSWTQTLYLQSDMQGAGWIQAIALDNQSSAANVLDSAKIYLGSTTMTSQPTSTVSTWVPMSDLTLVWSRTAYTIPGETGLLVIELDQPYYYDGTSTLVMVVSKAAAATSSNTKFGYTSTTASMKYTGGTTESYCNFPTVAGTNSTYKENIIFVKTASQNDAYCLPMQGVHVSGASTTSLTLNWDAAPGAIYEVGYTGINDSREDMSTYTTSSTSYTFTGLEPDSLYWLYVRKQCSNSIYSGWDSVMTRTMCLPMSSTELPYFEGFETTDANSSYSTAGVVPSCWTAYSNGTAPGYVPHVVTGTGSYIYRKSGDNSLVLYPGSASGVNGNTKYVLLPEVDEDLSNLYLNFWVCTESATNGVLDVGYVIGSDTSTFVSLATYPASSMTQHSGNGLQTGAGMDVELSLASVPSTASRLAFRWFYNGAYGVCLDDILLDYPPSCATPSDLTVVDSSAHTIELEWTGSATEFIIEYGPQGFVQGTGDSLSVATNSVTLEGLQMGAPYSIFITAVCGSDTSTGTLVGSFQTSCAPLTSDDLPYFEGFEAYGTGAANPINACWTKAAIGTTTNYPYPYTSAAVTGNRGLYFYSVKTSSLEYGSWVALPPIGDDLDMSELMINFKVKRGSSVSSTSTVTYSCRVIVGVADTAGVGTTFTPIDTLDYSTEAASSVHSAEVSFDEYTGAGKYVVLYVPAPESTTSSNYTTVYVDDITLRRIPNCFWPSAVALDDVSHEAATISWTPDSRTPDPSYWEVEYGEAGFTVGEGETQLVNDTTVTLTDLTSNTLYDVYVRAYCGGDASDPALFSFRTACTPVATTALPYVEDFETYASGAANPISPCWTKRAFNSTAQYPYPNTTAAITGSIGLYFYGYGSTGVSEYAAMPLFESDLSDLMISFYLKRYATVSSTYHSMIQVGVMSDPNDISTFELVQTYDLTNEPASSIHHILLSLEDYEGTGRYIAFYTPAPATSTHYNYIYLDSVVVDQLPACRWPVSLAADSVGAYEIDLSWYGSAENYEVQLSTTEDFTSATTTSTIVNTTSAVLMSLTPYTQYYVRVRGVCGDGNSMWTSAMPVTTTRDCGPSNINVIDTIGDGTGSSYTYAFYNYSSYLRGYSSTIYTVEELNGMGLQVNNRINGIKLHSGATGGTIYDAKVYVAETSLAGFGTPAANDTVNRSTMTLVYSGDLVVPANSWIDIPFATPFNYSGNNNLLITFARDTVPSANVNFFYTTTSPDYYNCYGYMSTTSTTLSATRASYRPNIIFDICTEIPNCVRPGTVTLLSYSDTSASIQWENTASNYEVVISTTSVNPDSVSGLTTYNYTTNSAVFNGLTPNTDYYVYVRSLCGAIGNSEWSIELSFRTACAPQPLPFTEDFESYPSGATNPINPCWVKGTTSTTAYPYPYSTNAVNGQRSLYFYAYQPASATSTPYYSYAALPMMDAPIDSLMVSFSMRRYSTTSDYYTSRIIVGVMDNPDDISTFVGVDTIDLKNEAALSVHYFDIPMSSYTGTGRYIAFYDAIPPLYGTSTYTYSHVYLDDIVVDYLPSCLRVSGVQVSNITTSSVDIQWDAVPGATSYDIEYGPTGFETGSGTTVSSTAASVSLSGLMHSTTFDVYVRAHCSATDAGNWSYPVAFATECGLNSLPIYMDFEGLATGTTSPMPHCWTKWNDNMTSSTGYYPYIYNSTSYSHSGTNSLYWYFYNSTTYPSDMIVSSPAIDTVNYPMNTVEVVFWARRNTNPMDLIVGVISDPNDPTTFTGVDTIELTTTHTEYTVSLSSFSGYGNHVAFRGVRSGTVVQYIYLDDILIEAISPCERAYDLTATGATATTVDLSWTDTIGSSQWIVSYTTDPNGTWTEVTAIDNPFTLTGLTPNTLYTYRVAPVCVDGQQADWSRETFTFSTSQIPATVPYSYNFEDATEWSNWQTSSNSNYSWFRGNAADGNSTYAMYLSADSGATQSWNLNTITNAVAYRDIDFGPDTHSYQVDFDAYYGGSTDGNYDGLAVLLVDPTVPVSSQSTGLTTPWGHVNNLALMSMRHDTLWGHYTAYLDGVSGVQRVVFYHFNQATAANHPYEDNPPAVDNITIGLQPCERPGMLAVDTVTPYSAELSWYGDPTATYQVAYRVQGTASSTNLYQTVTGPVAYIGSLNPATSYYWWVRKICTLTETDTLVSSWSFSSAFTTGCAPVSVADTLFEDFESYTATSYSTAGVLPTCWEGFTTGPSGYVPHVTDSGSYSYCVSGRQAITMTSGTSTTYGSDSYFRMVDVAEPTNSLTVAFWMCTESSTNGYLEVGYLAGDSYELDFVPLKRIDASTATNHSGNGIQPAGHGIFDTVRFDTVPEGNYPIVFHWNYTSSYYSVCIDDIAVWSDFTCYVPQNIDVTADYQSATFNTQSTDATYIVAYGTQESALTDTATFSTAIFTVSGLQPATRYYFSIRKQCDEESLSPAATGYFETEVLPCFAPTGIAISDITFRGATASWTAGGEEANWEVNIFNTNINESYTTTSPTYAFSNLTTGTQYSVSVRALCGSDASIEGPWSDTVVFTTDACQATTQVSASSLTATTATISWSAAGNGTGSYILEYGFRGMSQGEGTSVTVNATSYTITGLQPETEYDVYISTVCEGGAMSVWSNVYSFTTPAASGNIYTISAVPADPTMGSVQGGGSFEENTQITLTAVPNEGYHFVRWQDGNTDNPRVVTVTGNATYVATFEANAGIEDINGAGYVSLYPNPASSTVTVSVEGNESEVVVTIVDMNGREVKRERTSGSVLMMDISSLSQGAYFVRLTGDRVNAIRKLIVK